MQLKYMSGLHKVSTILYGAVLLVVFIGVRQCHCAEYDSPVTQPQCESAYTAMFTASRKPRFTRSAG
jgi:hypothetical protein